MHGEKGKSKRGFRLALLLIVFINLAGIAAALCWLWSRLSAYEADNPITAMNAFFTSIHEGGADGIASRMEHKGLNTAEDYAAWLRRTYPGDVETYRYAPLDDEEPGARYAVYSGDTRLGTVRLFSEDNKTGPWTVQPEAVYLDPYTIRAPRFVELSMNGKRLPASCLTGKSAAAEDFATQRDAGRIPQIVEYTVTDLLEEPVFTAQTPDGTPCRVSAKEPRSLSVNAYVPAEQLDSYEKRMETAAKLYARYISQDATWEQLAEQLYTDTELYKAVRSYDSQYYNKHTSYAFENFAVTGVERFSEDAFAGDVSFEYVISRTHDTHTFPTKYRMAFQRIGGDYKLVDLRIQ